MYATQREVCVNVANGFPVVSHMHRSSRVYIPLSLSLSSRSLLLSSYAFVCRGVSDWEVVIVDDNSPDGTLAVAEELQKVYGKDKLVRR